jgi:hypothetical protein
MCHHRIKNVIDSTAVHAEAMAETFLIIGRVWAKVILQKNKLMLNSVTLYISTLPFP